MASRPSNEARSEGLDAATVHTVYIVTVHSVYIETVHTVYIVTVHTVYVVTVHTVYIVTVHSVYIVTVHTVYIVTAEVQTASVAYFQIKMKLFGFSAYPDVLSSQLNRLYVVLLYFERSYYSLHCNYYIQTIYNILPQSFTFSR
jgi:hypothetical protein